MSDRTDGQAAERKYYLLVQKDGFVLFGAGFYESRVELSRAQFWFLTVFGFGTCHT